LDLLGNRDAGVGGQEQRLIDEHDRDDQRGDRGGERDHGGEQAQADLGAGHEAMFTV
jgi:hypothetical protein